MASSMELRVLAEGVEEDAQLRLLQEKRCDEVQGYLLSRPLPSQDVPGFFGRRRSAEAGPSAATAAGLEAIETILRSAGRQR
jgi:predicted signal transduction protein with EAL and GGDEF domain